MSDALEACLRRCKKLKEEVSKEVANNYDRLIGRINELEKQLNSAKEITRIQSNANADLKKENARLRECVEFYADERCDEFWMFCEIGFIDEKGENERGKKARATLKELAR